MTRQDRNRTEENRVLIRLDHVSCSYDGIPALTDITCSFCEGVCYSVEGPNGSGKSTLFRVLNGLTFAEAGTCYFMGEPVNEKSMRKPAFARKLHHTVGYVFQNPEIQLFCKTVEEEVMFGLIQLGLSDDQVRERCGHYLKELEIESIRNRAPYTLSGGEKKRTALASVLAMEPKILILDEPLEGLDEDGEAWMRQFLREIRSPERTVLFATHRGGLAEEIADVRIRLTKDHRMKTGLPER